MHPNNAFRQAPESESIALARQRGFGTLCVNAEGGPLVSHIPFRIAADASHVEAHLVRSNPIVRLIGEPADAVIAVSGGDGYVSPDWYGVENQVPTWNYVAVHLRGKLRLLPQEELHPILDRLSADFEGRLMPKKPWDSAKMDQEIYARMLRQIVPVRLEIERVDSTWKLSQNKTDEARMGAAAGMRETGIGMETAMLAILMEKAATGN